jgi:ATP phosphoribosyltransferase regulatory subunit
MRTHSFNKPKTLVPKGVATFLPEGVLLRRNIEHALFSVFFRAGYQEVITPLFEYLDVFAQTSGEELLDRSYKFVDRATGRIMVLRPDVTPQIARMAATWLVNRPRPLKLCYSTTLFRHTEEYAGQEREILQMGAEQIGSSDAQSDADMILLAFEALKKIKIKSKIVLGQTAFIRGILKPFESDPIFFRKILSAVAKKEILHLSSLLKGISVGASAKAQVLALPSLLGGEDVLKKAEQVSRNPLCVAGLERLSDVVRILTQKGLKDSLLIDLSEVRGFDYYTGIVFEIFSDGANIELGGGGRYDHLAERFGASSPSIGFALNIEQIQRVKEGAMH